MADPTVAVDTIYIPQGGTFSKAWPLLDAYTLEIADTTGWAGRCEVRDKIGGNLVTSFHSDRVGHSGWPGVISFDGLGNVFMTMTYTKTGLLTPVANAVFDLELINPNGDAWTVVRGRAHVIAGVTTDV